MAGSEQHCSENARQERRDLERVVEQFELAWQHGERPDIDAYLAASNGDRQTLLVELVHADLEYRIKAGEAVQVESYLGRFPGLQTDRVVALELIAAEYALRCRREPSVTPEQYVARFPQLGDVIFSYLRDFAERCSFIPDRPRCPHCRNLVPMDGRQTAEKTVCPACGSTFRFDNQSPMPQLRERPVRLGRFQILESIGHGSFATVYRALDTQLHRIVAVKVPRDGRLASVEDQERFEREARSVAQFCHPGIVPVYEVGRSDQFPYIVCEYVEGVTLADALKTGCFDFREAAKIVADVGDALDHAHQHGIVHRDLKPSNIMLESRRPRLTAPPSDGKESTTTAGGNGRDGSLPRPDPRFRARLMDFGLARRDEGEVTVTFDGQVLGTPAYMSPEQARGEAHRVDTRSDVYSLGVILFELITGELPFRGNIRMLLEQVSNDEPRPPRRLNDRIPRDLETICLKAMAKGPAQRYQTAARFVADLRHWLAAEPIEARPVGVAGHAWRWTKRHPRLIGVAAVIAASVALLSWLGHEIAGRTHARRLTQAILTATPSELPALVNGDLQPYRRWAEPLLRVAANEPGANSERRLRASLALVHEDNSQRAYLAERLLDCSFAELPLVRDGLKPPDPELANRLWAILNDATASALTRFRAGLALAAFSPNHASWSDTNAAFVTEQLLTANLDDQRELRNYLRPIASKLLAPLQASFGDESARDRVREAAAVALADYAQDDSLLLVRLASDATAPQFEVLYSALTNTSKMREATEDALQQIVRQQPASDLCATERVSLGRRRANAAITLLRMEHALSLDQLLRVDQDPESLTQFAHGCKERQLRPEVLLQHLEVAEDERERFGLMLALGEYSRDEIQAARAQLLIEKLLEWYRHDPSSAVHGASGWLLRAWGEHTRTSEVDHTPLPYDVTGKRQWFVDRVGEDYFTFIVYRPGEFVRGSPESEPDRDSDEVLQPVQLTRPFAIADSEVTVSQWLRFVRAAVAQDSRWNLLWPRPNAINPTLEHVFTGTDWGSAAMFCRWLTEQAGMAEEDQCYEPPDTIEKLERDFPETWPCNPDRPGFRVLFEAEWEYACRCGMISMYSFGSDTQLLDRYAWFHGNAGNSSHVPRQLRPNLRGLFDVHGNAFEWCNDTYSAWTEAPAIDPLGPQEGRTHMHRGGAWDYPAWYCRSAQRGTAGSPRHAGLGLRVARTLPSASD